MKRRLNGCYYYYKYVKVFDLFILDRYNNILNYNRNQDENNSQK